MKYVMKVADTSKSQSEKHYTFVLQNYSVLTVSFLRNNCWDVSKLLGKYIKEAIHELKKYVSGRDYLCTITSTDTNSLQVFYYIFHRERKKITHRPYQLGASLIIILDGIKLYEEYLTNGEYERPYTEGAGYISREFNGEIKEERFYDNGKLRNEKCYSYSLPFNKSFLISDECFNGNKSTLTQYSFNGQKMQLLTFENDELHNPLDGAIVKFGISHRKKETVVEKDYFLQGRRYEKKEWKKERLKYL